MNKNLKINVQLLENSLNKPKYASNGASGFDLTAGIAKDIVIKVKEFKTIPTGLVIEIPYGFEGQVRSRSGLAAKQGIAVLNSPGTIDCDYRGEIKVILINLGDKDFLISPGMRIAQMVITPTYKVKIKFLKKISINTSRGSKGFGSTGL